MHQRDPGDVSWARPHEGLPLLRVGSGCPSGLAHHEPAKMRLGQGHQSQRGFFRSPQKTYPGIQPCALCPPLARRWLWREPRGKARLPSWYPAGDEAGWLSGEVVLSPISSTLPLPRHRENRSVTLVALSNAETFPKSPRCPAGRSDVNFCTAKVICFREFYLCKYSGTISCHSHLPRQVFNKGWEARGRPGGERVRAPGGEKLPGI